MTSLLILAIILLVLWLWGTWQRDGHASFMRDWAYVPLVASITCLFMAVGLWIR